MAANEAKPPKARRRASIIVACLVVVAALLAYAVWTLWAPALVLVRNTPQLAWASDRLPARVNIVRRVEPTPGDPRESGALYVPQGKRQYPGVLLVNGAEVPAGWQDPAIETFARSLAELGEIVYVPDLPGLKTSQFSTDILPALSVDIAWFHRSVPNGQVSLVGICVGASIALSAAARPENDGLVHTVVAIDPYARIKNLLQAATTGQGQDSAGQLAPYDMVAWVRADLVTALTAEVVPDPPSRRIVLDALKASPEQDPLRTFRSSDPPNDLSPSGRTWWDLLASQDLAEFESRYQALPEIVRRRLDELSPLTNASRLRIPVLLAAPFDDFAFPAGEAWALQQVNPQRIRLIRSSALDHATPSFSFSVLAGYWQMLRFAVEGNALLH